MTSPLKPLPLSAETQLETPAVLRQLSRAHRFLGELKGGIATIPNQDILTTTLGLREATRSSEIENIITTQDELFGGDAEAGDFVSGAAKEVHRYARALKEGFERVSQTKLIRLSDIIAVQEVLEPSKSGLRKIPGTKIKNASTGEVVYEPPQGAVEVSNLMDNLVTHLNSDSPSDPDPLVKMAILHWQFESIHPFYDGNGRTGRIINLLYLVRQELMNLPVLYMSGYILRHKEEYYSGFSSVRENGDWEGWLLYMIRGVEETAIETLKMVHDIRDLIEDTRRKLAEQHGKKTSLSLVETLFRNPYTKIEFVERDLGVSRPTATKYLERLVESGILRKIKLGRSNFYLHASLLKLLSR